MVTAEGPFASFSESNESGQREIHIWEFPPNFRVQLEPKMMEELVNRAKANVGTYVKLANTLNVNKRRLYTYRKSKHFTPLSLLLQLCELADDKFTIDKVEPHIVAYKGGASAHPILNPHLPVRETPELFAVIAHLIGDGGNTTSNAYYTNTNDALIQEFLRLLQAVFGDVPVRISVQHHEAPVKDVTAINFGMTIVHLLQHLYQITFRTFTARVPRRLFDLSREYAAAFLRAFGDDEGHVYDDHISLYSANKKLVQDLSTLFQTKFPELGEFMDLKTEMRKKRPIQILRFRTGAFASYKMYIGFNHSEKRQELDRILTRREREWTSRNPGETQRMILALLARRPLTSKQLARKLDIGIPMVRRHLYNGLILSGFVVSTGKTRTGKMFELTERGRRFLQLPAFGLLGRRGQRKLEILKILVGGSLTSAEIERKLGLKRFSVRHQLTGVRDRGRWRPGLLELGLITRSGSGTNTDPYSYSLTEAGNQFLIELETLIPECGVG